MLQDKSPHYLYSMFNTTYNYKTRVAESGKIRQLRTPGSGSKILELAKDSFKWRAADLYNNLPGHIRSISTLPSFKQQTKQWVAQNIELV